MREWKRYFTCKRHTNGYKPENGIIPVSQRATMDGLQCAIKGVITSNDIIIH